MCNDYIWSLDKQKGSKPKIGWKHVCKPRAYGRLNIRNIQLWNDVALLKSLWALAYKKDRLWESAEFIHYLIPSSASWMLARKLESREHVTDWNELN